MLNKLGDELQKIAPIVSVRGDAADKGSLEIVFKEDATDEQKQAAQQFLSGYEELPELSVADLISLLVNDGVLTKEKVDAARRGK